MPRSAEIRAGRALGAYTLVELSIALAIVGILVSITGSQYMSYLDRARMARAIVELRNFAAQIDPSGDEDASWPATLAEAGITANDPWGNPYQYLLIDGNLPRGLAANEPALPAVAAPPANAGGGAGASAGAGGDPGAAGGGGAAAGGAGTPAAAGGQDAGGGGSGSGSIMGQVRKDRFLAPINTDYDLYSLGPDGESRPQLNARESRDDIVRAANGSYFGVAEDF